MSARIGRPAGIGGGQVVAGRTGSASASELIVNGAIEILMSGDGFSKCCYTATKLKAAEMTRRLF